jgi:hypothetical protein
MTKSVSRFHYKKTSPILNINPMSYSQIVVDKRTNYIVVAVFYSLAFAWLAIVFYILSTY